MIGATAAGKQFLPFNSIIFGLLLLLCTTDFAAYLVVARERAKWTALALENFYLDDSNDTSAAGILIAGRTILRDNGCIHSRRRIGQLAIANPCRENWDAMAGGHSGRLCTACNRSVYDLSVLTRRQVADLLDNNAGKILRSNRLRRARQPNFRQRAQSNRTAYADFG
jgi:hypothetical protein